MSELELDETYLGDGLYASNDGWMIRLTADKHSPKERSVWIEPSVWAALQRYAEGMWPQAPA